MDAVLKLLEFLKGVRPNTYLLWVGGFMVIAASLDHAGIFSVVPDMRNQILYTGLAIIVIGSYLAFSRAKAENEAENALKKKRAPRKRKKA